MPDWEFFADRAVAISQGLFDKLEAGLVSGKPFNELEAIRKQIEQLGNIVRVAGLVIGYMKPFRPKPRTTSLIKFAGTLPQKEVKTIFPWMQDAIDFLQKKEVVPASEFAGLSIDQQQAAFTAPGMEDRDELSKLRDDIAKGQDQEDGGESLAEFRKRVGDQVALTRAQTESVFRTNVKQGYVTGFDNAMKSRLVSDVFPAVMFSATRDGRVRALHWELEGFICLKSDPAYKVLLRALKDWGCRCNLIPMTMEQATKEGIKTFNDLPQDVIEKYGQGLSALPESAPVMKFVPHPTQRDNPRAYQTIIADTSKLDEEWSKDESNYLPKEGFGKSEVKGRREDFQNFLLKGKPIEQPRVVVDDQGNISFGDGRHRTRVLINGGLKEIPITVERRDADRIRSLVGSKK